MVQMGIKPPLLNHQTSKPCRTVKFLLKQIDCAFAHSFAFIALVVYVGEG